MSDSRHDDLAALLGLGMLGAMMDDQSFQKTMQERRERSTASGAGKSPDKPETTTEEAAKAAKRIYDAYIQAGFSPEQAFDLLKIVLSRKGR